MREAKRWTWENARRLAIAILLRAEARRREIAEAEARFYATDDDP